MLTISISPQFQKEKEYIISVLLKDFLGLNYTISIDESEVNYVITYNHKKLIIEDGFFNEIKSETYITKDNIPSKIQFIDIDEFKNLPIIYGNSKVENSENIITLGIDIFSSSFFMLTRWEEIVMTEKDNHNRFLTSSSLAYKNNFHRRPIVNEYVELLWSYLLKLGLDESNRRKREYTIQFTHDVDHPLLFPHFMGFTKQIAYQLLKKGNVKKSIKLFKHYVSQKKDPYNTFDYLMGVSEKKGVKSQFNFMNTKKGEFEEGYDLVSTFNQALIKKIKDRGHTIGFHPSYDTYNSPALWKKEKEGLEKIINQKITTGRQHYLRFENPITWQIWEKNNMQEDATLGYADEVGFRAGTCYSYHPFDVMKREKLNLIETPLILMEGALINSLHVSPPEFIKISTQLKNEVKKYNGTYSVLWHNSSFFLDGYDKYTYLLNEF